MVDECIALLSTDNAAAYDLCMLKKGYDEENNLVQLKFIN